MGIIDKLFGHKNAQATLVGQPVEVNPSNPAQLKRHAARLANLYSAQGEMPDRADIADEIAQRRNAIALFGHDVPNDEAEARALLARMET